MATPLFSSDPVSHEPTEPWLLDVCRRYGQQDPQVLRWPAGHVAPREVILIVLQRTGPLVPGLNELIRRFGFTTREADVAQRLAYGGSDRTIAAELHLSPHTIRHHVEAIFLKVGVTSRKALALHLNHVGCT
jgi:DNA-binding CsgD family transcriptional regulator